MMGEHAVVSQYVAPEVGGTWYFSKLGSHEQCPSYHTSSSDNLVDDLDIPIVNTDISADEADMI